MRIDPRSLGLAAGNVGALLSALCGLALIVAPGATSDVVGFLIHTDLGAMTRPPSLAGMFGAAVAWGLISGLSFALAAWLYNRFAAPAPSHA